MAEQGNEIRLKGLTIGSGKVAAQVCLYSARLHHTINRLVIQDQALLDADIERFKTVRGLLSNEYDEIAVEVEQKLGKAESEIFVTQKHIMNDQVIVTEIIDKVLTERVSIEYSVSTIFKSYQDKMSKLQSVYLTERSSDIEEVRSRLLDRLLDTKSGFVCEGNHVCKKGADRIIVAESLSSEMLVKMNFRNVLGIVTEHGGVTSHAAIIARSMGIPAVSGVVGIYGLVRCGMHILVDGDAAEVVLEPSEDTVAKTIPVDYVNAETVCMLSSPLGIRVYANVSFIEDVEIAQLVHADGIGLLRTEIAFLKQAKLLTEEEQYEFYLKVCEMMHPKPVIFRLLDIGGDKELPLLPILKEANPLLGLRGARYLLNSKEVLNTQVRALFGVCKFFPIKIMIPMVIDTDQLLELKTIINHIAVGMNVDQSQFQIGAMIEVPSAYVLAEEIFDMVDFVSVGSNDLIQYLFAIDRTNEMISQDFYPSHPALFRVLQKIADISKYKGKELSLCGEIAGRTQLASQLLQIGFRSLSVSPRLIPRIRNEAIHFFSQQIESRP